MEDVKAYQSYYMEEVNHVSMRTFDKNLVNIAPPPPKYEGFRPQKTVFHSVRLYLTDGFMWEREVWEEDPSEDCEMMNPTMFE